MEALAGLSVAVNVAQFVVYGLQSAQYLYKAYNQTSEFLDERSELSDITNGVRASGDTIKSIPEVKGDSELVKMIDQAGKLADNLVRKLEALDRRMSGRLAKARVAFHALRVKSDIEQLLKRLVALRDQITSHLIILSSKYRRSNRGQLDDLHATIMSNNEEVSRTLNRLYDNLIKVRDDMRGASDEKVLDLLETMANDTISTTKHCMLRKRVEYILQSLKFDNISDRESAIPKAHQQTFQWALSDTKATLPRWLRTEDGIYWIEGKAGSGKSTLMKFLQRDPRTTAMLEDWANGRPLTFVSHYFWGPGAELQKSLVGLFRTLLFQILVKDPEMIRRVCPLRDEEEGYGHLKSWTLEELEACFHTISSMERLPSKLCFFIDGLDEFEGDTGTLIDFMRTISNSKSGDIKLCVASRPWLRFQEAFGMSHRKLSVHELTHDDIKRYSQENLGKSRLYRQLQAQFPDQASLLVQEITDAANGVFLWVYLVVRQLLEGLSNHDDLPTLRNRLQRLPRELDKYFRRMLNSIEDIYQAESFSLFSILAYTRLPLNTLLTWGHGKFWQFSSPNPFDIEEFITHRSWLQLKAPSRAVPRAKSSYRMYEPEEEKKLVVARCKDLIHVSEDLTRTVFETEVYEVGFLHRTVAEFISSAITAVAKCDPIRDRIQMPMPIVTLAETYLQLLDPKSAGVILGSRDEDFLRILCLASQAKQHSASSYLHIMHQLSLVLGYGPQGANLHTNIHSSFVGTAMASDICATTNCSHHDAITENWEALFWILHCRGCIAKYRTTLVQDLCRKVCFKSHQIPLLSEDGTIRLKKYSEINLSIVEAFVRVLRLGGSDRFVQAWQNVLEAIIDLPDSNEWPSNIFDVCLVFIHHGAPRLVRPQKSSKEDGNLDALAILMEIPSVREADSTGSRLELEFQNAEWSEPEIEGKVSVSSARENFSFWGWVTGRI